MSVALHTRQKIKIKRKIYGIAKLIAVIMMDSLAIWSTYVARSTKAAAAAPAGASIQLLCNSIGIP